jgi:hypothetical protein
MDNIKKRYFPLNFIRKIVKKEKPGLIAINLTNGFETVIIIFKQNEKYYKTEGKLNFFKEADKNISIECEEVVLEVQDYLYKRNKNNENG